MKNPNIIGEEFICLGTVKGFLFSLKLIFDVHFSFDSDYTHKQTTSLNEHYNLSTGL